MQGLNRQADLRKRKMMLVLPAMVIPFLTLGFFALGGGQGTNGDERTKLIRGLNLQLPDANLKEEQLTDKLSFYEKAAKDSLRLNEWLRSDPYYKEDAEELEELTEETASKYGQQLRLTPYEKQGKNPEDELMRKLSLLQQELNRTSEEKGNATVAGDNSTIPFYQQAMPPQQTVEDPEIKQLSNVMEQILDVQHPERVEERKKVQMTTTDRSLMIAAHAKTDTAVKGFYGMTMRNNEQRANAIRAVVHEEQLLTDGAVIRLRLLQDLFIADEKIEKGNFVSGLVKLQGERLAIDIRSIRTDRSLYPVQLEVYDLDGMPGIHIPGAITRDVSKESAANSLQLMELGTVNPSLKMQATTAAVNAARSLLTRKVKLVRVMVKAGYQLFIQNKDL